MGKTGGSTISVQLRNGCHSFMPHPCRPNLPNETIASKLIEKYYHVPDFDKLPKSNHDFYLISCRDPYDRSRSAFTWNHISNVRARKERIQKHELPDTEEAYKCFPTLQSFVDYLGDDPHKFNYPYGRDVVNTESCQDLARAAFNSQVKIYGHTYYSYKKILSLLEKRHETHILAIRQEYLWSDWNATNVYLGQEEPVYIPYKKEIRNSTALKLNNKYPVPKDLDENGRKILCLALVPEYWSYFWMIKHSRNLSIQDKEETIHIAQKNCPNLNFNDILSSIENHNTNNVYHSLSLQDDGHLALLISA